MRTCALLICLMFAPSAAAQTIVTLCQTDIQVGAPKDKNLAQAIQTGGRIRFSCPAGTTLRITREHFINTATELDGGNKVILDAQNATNMFRAVSGGHVFTLRDIVLRRGAAVSGRRAMIWGVMDIVLDHVEINGSDHPVRIDGGKITAQNSTFFGNVGPVLDAPNLVVRGVRLVGTAGPALHADGGEIILHDVQVAGNRAPTDKGSEFTNCSLTVSNSQFMDMWTTASVGGAIRTGCPTTRIVDSVFTNNRAVDGGGLYLTPSATDVELRSLTFEGNQASRQGGAIAIENSGGTRTIRLHYGRFRGNQAARGGAISLGDSHLSFNQNVLEGSANTFRANSASEKGGAIYGFNAALKLARAIFVDNVAFSSGGAITLDGPSLRPFVLANGIVARTKGGGAAIESVTGADFLNATIADNETGGVSSAGRVNLTNTVFSNNRRDNCTFGVGGNAINRGASLEFPKATCVSGILVKDPELDNFFVPSLSSPLQRTGLNAACTQQPINGRDVYGQRRPRGSRCTIGAVEGDIEQLIRKTKKTDRRVRKQ